MHKLFARSCLWLVILLLSLSALSGAQVRVAISFGPPPLPVYEQPPCPAEGYMWVPGYWAYDYDFNDYYWVPGTWVLAPQPGLLWTPGYWAWNNDRFFFHEGYWGRRVGFYGGVVYGFGYFGHGYEGGRWDHDRFYYNRSVTNVNTTVVRNVYNTTVINKTTVINRVSYNGGNGGITARATRDEENEERERHVAPPPTQVRHVEEARRDPQLRAASNRGKPPVAATEKPAAFHDSGAVQAREAGGPYHPREDNPSRGNAPAGEPNRNVPRPGSASHARDVQPHERPPAPNTGDTKRDQKYEKADEKFYSKEQKDHQKLQQRQDKEDQRLDQKRASDASRQQMEQKHQQQTQKMEQKHDQQTQKLQQKQRPPASPPSKAPNAEPPR